MISHIAFIGAQLLQRAMRRTAFGDGNFKSRIADSKTGWDLQRATPEIAAVVVVMLGLAAGHGERHSDALRHDFDARIRRFDGVYRWCQVRGLPLRNTNGGITRWYVVLTDIDERKRAEQALRDSEHNLKLIIDTIPALAWSARTDGSAEFFNRHYLDFIGLSAEQASGWG